ncbi:MAG: heterodisulfide reductase-related iron-sulfur binding cluster [Vicinamibacterales bacterium]
MAESSNAFASLAPLTPLMDTCVHCGFCLQTCPSYLLLGKETDSPRGRIYAMRAGLDGRLDMSPTVVEHFDTCLGCMACETACPSGVKYAPLIEQTRVAVEHHHARPAGEQRFRALLFRTLPYPSRLRLLGWPLALLGPVVRSSWVQRLIPQRFRPLAALAPDVTAGALLRDTPELTPASGERRMRVGLVTGCVQRAYFGRVNDATARVLAAEGCEVVAPRTQGCCGALALHAGEADQSRAFARALIASFEHAAVDRIVINAAGCGSALKEYGHLLADDPAWAERAAAFSSKIRDVSEMLVELGPPRAARHRIDARVAYHDACHLAHAQGVRTQPRDLLTAIPGITLVPVAEAEVCCGSAGIFNLTQPEMAGQLGRRKAAHLSAANPTVVVTSNPGCLLQIQAAAREQGHDLPVRHLVDILDASISGRAAI